MCGGGLFYAEYGGSGGPRLACDEHTGRCLWFADGCVASGYRPVECPLGNPCCFRSADGPWPFADGWEPSRSGSANDLLEDIAVIGEAPVGRASPANISVTIDPAVPAATGWSVACLGDATIQLCDGNPIFGSGAFATDDTLVIAVRNRAAAAEALLVEVSPEADGAYVGRAWFRQESDGSPPRGMLTCDRARSPAAPLGGSLRLDRFDLDAPESVHGVLVLELDTDVELHLYF
jgi:hypothetical protein